MFLMCRPSGKNVQESFTKRLQVSYSLDFDTDSNSLWRIISKPGNLNQSHPFCKSNEVINWDENNRKDRLIYLNGRNYVRDFLTWDEGIGYTLLIGEENGKQSYVTWKIEALNDNSSKLTITVYTFILAKLPKIFAIIPHLFWVNPRLKQYLHSVISGFQYHLETGNSIPRNHFGKHSWFS